MAHPDMGKTLGGVLFALLGWAIAQVIGQMQQNEDTIITNGNRISVLETQMKDHQELHDTQDQN
jgi:hypothetical protein